MSIEKLRDLVIATLISKVSSDSVSASDLVRILQFTEKSDTGGLGSTDFTIKVIDNE